MDKSKIIVWEKWRDPLGYDDIEEKLTNNNSQQKLEDEENENVVETNDQINIKTIQEQYALTPLGMIPLTENTVSSKIFNFWTGHTIFPISKKIASVIENIDGVETLDIFTKYRFRIAVGKAFKDSVVLRQINDIIYTHITDRR